MKSREYQDLERQISLVKSSLQAEIRRLGMMYETEILRMNDRIQFLEQHQAGVAE